MIKNEDVIGSEFVKDKIFVAILLAFFCVSCNPLLVADLGPRIKFKDHEIKYWVKNGVLEPHPSNNGCPKLPGAGKGCVAFEEGTLGIINLTMAGGMQDKTCADSHKPDYVIVKVELTDNGTDDKGDFPLSSPPPAWIVAAFPTMDPDNGIVYEADPDPASSDPASESAMILNLNNNDVSAGVKTSWYRVTVQDCDGGPLLVSDPRIPNHGNN